MWRLIIVLLAVVFLGPIAAYVEMKGASPGSSFPESSEQTRLWNRIMALLGFVCFLAAALLSLFVLIFDWYWWTWVFPVIIWGASVVFGLQRFLGPSREFEVEEGWG